jgi:hypothetical protein
MCHQGRRNWGGGGGAGGAKVPFQFKGLPIANCQKFSEFICKDC